MGGREREREIYSLAWGIAGLFGAGAYAVPSCFAVMERVRARAKGDDDDSDGAGLDGVEASYLNRVEIVALYLYPRRLQVMSLLHTK